MHLAVRGGRVRPQLRRDGQFKTSVSLEPLIWQAFQEIAEEQNKTATALINEIDRKRDPEIGLSAAIRLYVVSFYRSTVKLG